MAKQRITGSFVALITPFNTDGSVDYAGFKTLIDFQRSHGTRALLIMGSSGEVSMLTTEERHNIVRETMRHKSLDLPLWYGCTGASTQATIDYVRQAASEGADGAIVAAPAYVCASNADIVQFFCEVADASPIPIGIYNNPPRVKTDLSHEEILALSCHPNIVINKESTARVGQVAQLIAAKPDMSLMCCCSPNLGLVVPTMTLGGHGTANMTGNIIPREMAAISEPLTAAGDGARFREAYLHALPMLHFVYSAINPVPVKSLMRAVGLPAGPLRKPLTALDRTVLDRGLAVARTMGLDRIYGYRLDTLAAAE